MVLFGIRPDQDRPVAVPFGLCRSEFSSQYGWSFYFEFSFTPAFT